MAIPIAYIMSSSPGGWRGCEYYWYADVGLLERRDWILTSNDMNNHEFNKFARMHQGISSNTLNRYESAVDAYINPSIISEHSGQPYHKASADGECDFWMTAKEAMEYGMVDQILTKK